MVLSCEEDVAAAHAATGWRDRGRVERVVVDLPGMSPKVRAQAEQRIHRLRNDCGCLWGELGLLVVLLGLTVGPAAGWVDGVLPVSGCALAAAVGGKLLGLAWSRRRLRVELGRLCAQAGSAMAAGDNHEERGGGPGGRSRVP